MFSLTKEEDRLFLREFSLDATEPLHTGRVPKKGPCEMWGYTIEPKGVCFSQM